MKKTISIIMLFTFLIGLFLTGCKTQEKTQEKTASKSAITVQYAKGFKIESISDGIKKVTDGDGREMLLVSSGQKAPDKYKDLPVIYTPVKKVITASTTQAALLRPLGVLNTVVGVTTPENQWYIDEIKQGLKNGSIKYLGQNSAPNYEEITKISPDVVFLYTQSGMAGTEDFPKKLKELGVPYAVDNEWLENDPIARLEWIKFLAAFYNKDKEASDFFNNAVKKINEIKDKVPKENKPKVAWGQIYKGMVYVPTGGSYVAKMIDMAGGDNIFKDVQPTKTGNVTMTLEEFYARANNADILIYPASTVYMPSVSKLVEQAPVLKDIKPIKEGKVWCLQPQYWQDLDKTEQVIADLAAIFHPKDFTGHKLQEFEKLPEK
ncbi:MAG: ABC transporter substrate-binding protein [Thermoanaerobacteraceae bacterium]|nr:ABC transporter substrate-binding protein [Thermoanaerobacteraceae bacterium]